MQDSHFDWNTKIDENNKRQEVLVLLDWWVSAKNFQFLLILRVIKQQGINVGKRWEKGLTIIDVTI